MTDSNKPRRSVTGMPPAAIRLEFGRTLQRHLNERGWTQAELARRMAPLMKGSRIGRDNISKYIRGKVLPLPPALEAMAKVLEVEPNDLLPSRATRATAGEHAPIGLRDLGDGRAWLEIHVSQELPWATALKVIGLLRGDERPLQA
jgi:transcriptional regulator with XRE-family HTH domain